MIEFKAKITCDEPGCDAEIMSPARIEGGKWIVGGDGQGDGWACCGNVDKDLGREGAWEHFCPAHAEQGVARLDAGAVQ